MRNPGFTPIVRSCVAASLLLAAGAAEAGTLISAVGLQDLAGGSTLGQASTTAGATATFTSSDVTAKATTDFGINRIYNSAAAGTEGQSYASSVWGETFTAQGTGMVHVAFNFTIDGSVDYGALGGGRDFNYIVTALRGDWGLSSAQGYDDLQAVRASTTTEQVGPTVQTFNGTQSVNLDDTAYDIHTSATGSAGATMERDVTRNGDSFTLYTTTTNPDTQTQLDLQPGMAFVNGAGPIPYAGVPALGNVYQGLLDGYAILGRASLCADYNTSSTADVGCLSGTYPPTTVSLEFDINGGDSFTLFSALMSEDATDGTVDFFNTVKLHDITVTDGTITTDNRQFQPLGDGSYGFTPAAAAVPEAATWAMMVAGFGLMGAALRRHPIRRTASAL